MGPLLLQRAECESFAYNSGFFSCVLPWAVTQIFWQAHPREVSPLMLILFRWRQGIATMVLESPFYGKRLPSWQAGSRLLRVSDLLVLGRATIEESLCLLEWAAQQREFSKLGDAPAAAAAAAHESKSCHLSEHVLECQICTLKGVLKQAGVSVVRCCTGLCLTLRSTRVMSVQMHCLNRREPISWDIEPGVCSCSKCRGHPAGGCAGLECWIKSIRVLCISLSRSYALPFMQACAGSAWGACTLRWWPPSSLAPSLARRYSRPAQRQSRSATARCGMRPPGSRWPPRKMRNTE